MRITVELTQQEFDSTEFSDTYMMEDAIALDLDGTDEESKYPGYIVHVRIVEGEGEFFHSPETSSMNVNNPSEGDGNNTFMSGDDLNSTQAGN